MLRARGTPVAIAALGIAGLAWGQASNVRAVRVVYEAPATCPSEAQLVAEVRARTARVAFDEHAHEVVKVAIAGRERRFVGDASFVEESGRETHRRVEGGTCAEVVLALALVTALAIDPTASLEAAPSAPASASSGTSATATSAASASPASSASAAPRPATSAAPSASTTANPPPPPPPPTRPTEDVNSGPSAQPWKGWRLSFGVDAATVSGPAPSLVYSVPIFVELAQGTDSLLGLDARLRFSYAGTGAVNVPRGALDFTWTTGSLDLCPLAWSPGRARLVLCARGEAGVLAAQGVNIVPARSDARPWLAAGLVARAQYALFGPLFAEVEPSAFVPITRDRFIFEPSTTAFQASIAGWAGALGVGAAF